MATVGSLAYSIIANATDFKAGITASRAELKSLRAAFLDTQKPVERFSGAIQHLETLMAKFPTRANEVRRSIHAIKREMDSARFARGAAGQAGFMADLDAGLAGNKARDAAFMAAQIPGGGGMGGAGGKAFDTLITQSRVARASLLALRGGSVVPLIASLGAAGPAGGLTAAAVVAAAALATLATKSIAAADSVRQANEEFFKQVDALKAAGGNTDFARHVDRVKSLKTAWGEARTGLDAYLAAVGERTGASNRGVGLLSAFGMAATGAMMAVESPKGREQRLASSAAAERLKVEEEYAERVKAINEKTTKAREDAASRAYERQRDRMRKEAAEELATARDTMSKTARLRESLRTPGDNLRRELNEIMGLPLDSPTRLKALEALREKAAGMIPDEGGRSHAKSIAGIRGGSVEALRAQFPGGTDKSERELKAAEKTEKHTADAVVALGKIEAAIAKIEMGEAP